MKHEIVSSMRNARLGPVQKNRTPHTWCHLTVTNQAKKMLNFILVSYLDKKRLPTPKRSSFNLEFWLLGAPCLTVTHPTVFWDPPPAPSVPSCWLCKAPQGALPAPIWTLGCVHRWCCSSLGERHTGWPWMWDWGLWVGNSRLQRSRRLRVEASPQAVGGQTLWTPSWSLGRESLHSLCKNTATGGTEPGPRTQERRI